MSANDTAMPEAPPVVVRLGAAVFTSARTVRSNGYQLAARSDDLSPRDCAALVRWGPSHDSLAPGAVRSVNFFPLPSGACCLSLTRADGDEQSRRGGIRCYTHCLVCSPEDLARVAFNPWCLLAAAERSGRMACQDRLPARLPKIELPVSTRLWQAACDQQVARDVRGMLQQGPVAIVGAGDAESLVAGVWGAMSPVERRGCSFTTGLRHSPQRPFRLMCLKRDLRTVRRLARQGVTVLELAGQA